MVVETTTLGGEREVRVTRGRGMETLERLTVDGNTYLRQGAGVYRVPAEVEAADGYEPLAADDLAAEVSAHFAEPVTVHVEVIESGSDSGQVMRGELVRGPEGVEGVIAVDVVLEAEGRRAQVISVAGRGHMRDLNQQQYIAAPGDADSDLSTLLIFGLDFGPRFDEGIESVAYLGTKSVGSDVLRPYQLKIDGEWLTGRWGMEGASESDVFFDLLVDDDHRYRRSWVDDDDGRLSHDFTGWRAPIDIEAPPAHLVIDSREGA